MVDSVKENGLVIIRMIPGMLLKYIIADYNQKHDFNKLYVVNVTNGKKDEVIINYDISFDSYINGSFKNSLFIFDRDKKNQYEFNTKQNLAYQVGNKKDGIVIYKDNQKQIIDISKVLKQDYKFDHNYETSQTYNRFNKYNGNYYFYKKINNIYQIYKSPIENKKQMIYLFNTDSIETIKYADNYIYYKLGNNILYYNDMLGSKTILSNSEYKFNKTLNYYIYSEV